MLSFRCLTILLIKSSWAVHRCQLVKCYRRLSDHPSSHHQGLIKSDDGNRDRPWNLGIFNQLTRMAAREDFIDFSRREVSDRMLIFLNPISQNIHPGIRIWWSLDSSVGIATGYGLDSPGSIPGMARCFSSPQCPDQLWGPPSLLPTGYPR
jgi:hypothetical protein